MAQKIAESTLPITVILKNYKEKLYYLPSWQRDGKAWEPAKHEGFHRTLTEIIRRQKTNYSCLANLETPFYTFKISNQLQLGLNDGGNRINSLILFMSKPFDGVKSDLDLVMASIQEWIYRDEYEAYESFFRINNGTSLSPFELAKGILSNNLTDYDLWKVLFNTFAEEINAQLARANCKRIKKNRDQEHKQLRDNYSLLYRWLKEDRGLTSFDAGCSKLSQKPTISETLKESIEQKLVDILKEKNMNPNLFEMEMNRFIKILREFTATYLSLFQETKVLGESPSETHVRWLYHFWTYCCLNKIPIPYREEFIRALIKNTNGKASVYHHPKGDEIAHPHQNLALSNLSVLKTACRNMNFNFELFIPKSRRRNNFLADGFANSHNVSVIVDPNGITKPEPAPRNRSRGSATVDNDIFTELEKNPSILSPQ